MVHRIEVAAKHTDTRAAVLKKKLQSRGFSGITNLERVDVYTIDADLSGQDLEAIAQMLVNPVSQVAEVDLPLILNTFDWAIRIGYHPGVTDNIGNTAQQCIEDYRGNPFADQTVFSSQLLLLSGALDANTARAIADSLANPLIQRTECIPYREYVTQRGICMVPRVQLTPHATADIVDLLGTDDAALTTIGKKGIANSDGSRRGPLALDLTYLRAIQTHYRALGRNPTDIELESIAQRWSEHCRHTIFADPIDDISEGLFKRYIKGATKKILEEKRRLGIDHTVSLFTDNSGGARFDDQWVVSFKVETHNSPSALDPFGGAITGIVGVNRDAMGFGLGAKPIVNTYGFCFADPNDESPLFRDANLTQRMLSSRRIMEGVIDGVTAGGNCSGIPTPQGFLTFHPGYKGKPLVFVGTVGLMPHKSAGRSTHEKSALPGDYVVMVGGRVGKDGVHGATFSSEAMDAGSPATAVQIGDPITQKKLSDALVKEARDLGLYRSITDNGAGGLSCSVGEMANESGGCRVDLDRVPVKYSGLAPWEIWISESQERMTLAVPPDKWEQFSALMQRRGVEATVIGEFTNSGRCVVEYHGTTIMDLALDFLNAGMPARPMQTTYAKPTLPEPNIPALPDETQTLYRMMGRQNIASYAFVSRQYDHEVQGGSVLKPLQGRGQVNGDATISRPVLDSLRGIVLTQGINPTYSEIDTYAMAAAAIDTAVRNAIAAGGRLDELYLLDNFCWCSSDEPERLGQLKAAAQACYDVAVAYGTPFISGKDSMFNDFKGFDASGNPVKISVPPTLLISAMGIIPDVQKSTSLDAKAVGDLVYILGETHDELGGSEYYAMIGEETAEGRYIGKNVPKVDVDNNRKCYTALEQCIADDLVASAQSVHRGGLAAALAKTSMGGMLGMDISLEHLPGTASREDAALFSESQGRIVVTIAPEHREAFEQRMGSTAYAQLGTVRADAQFRITGKSGLLVVSGNLEELCRSYQGTFAGY